ncbi:MAG: GAF domain-containing sensor histidine kinase, partial [Chloroflexi bacterium]|nr:GAF domain-containing sensor histidine kinase [Chloroflexota bacterium]
VLREGKPLRVADISRHPDAVGFPPHHPTMRSFLGVPIVFKSRVLGDLYLADKIGAEEFPQEDQDMMVLFAAQAAVAIENARLFAEVERRAEESRQLYEVSKGLNRPVPLGEVLYSITRAASAILRSDAAHLMVLDEATGLLKPGALIGFSDIATQRLQVSVDEGAIGPVAWTLKPSLVQDASQEPSIMGDVVTSEGVASFAQVPILIEGELFGLLGVDYHRTNAVLGRAAEVLLALADHAAVAIQGERINRQLQRLAIVEERDRIGRDLHDGVIQSIYAVGLALEGLSDQVESNPREVARSIGSAVKDLNQIMRDIRSYIAELRPRELQGRRFDEALESLIRYLEERTGVYVALEVGFDLDRTLGERHIVNLWHIFQEAFSNIEKYAQAKKVLVSLAHSNGTLALRIADDGVGFDVEQAEAGTGFGLANIKDRAERLGGIFTVESSPVKGTLLDIKIPLESDG